MDSKTLSPEQVLSVIREEVHQQMHHAAAEIKNSPDIVNRGVGEAMRHIGSLLEMSSGPYLPVRPEEMLARPTVMAADCNDAVLLVRRTISSSNAFMILATVKTVNDKRLIEFWAFKPDNFNLTKTQFLTLEEGIGNEIIRQLNLIMKGEGSALMQCVVISNYFPSTAADGEQSNLYNSDPTLPSGEKPAAGPIEEPDAGSVPRGLPPVISDTDLL